MKKLFDELKANKKMIAVAAIYLLIAVVGFYAIQAVMPQHIDEYGACHDCDETHPPHYDDGDSRQIRK